MISHCLLSWLGSRRHWKDQVPFHSWQQWDLCPVCLGKATPLHRALQRTQVMSTFLLNIRMYSVQLDARSNLLNCLTCVICNFAAQNKWSLFTLEVLQTTDKFSAIDNDQNVCWYLFVDPVQQEMVSLDTGPVCYILQAQHCWHCFSCLRYETERVQMSWFTYTLNKKYSKAFLNNDCDWLDAWLNIIWYTITIIVFQTLNFHISTSILQPSGENSLQKGALKCSLDFLHFQVLLRNWREW